MDWTRCATNCVTSSKAVRRTWRRYRDAGNGAGTAGRRESVVGYRAAAEATFSAMNLFFRPLKDVGGADEEVALEPAPAPAPAPASPPTEAARPTSASSLPLAALDGGVPNSDTIVGGSTVAVARTNGLKNGCNDSPWAGAGVPSLAGYVVEGAKLAAPVIEPTASGRARRGGIANRRHTDAIAVSEGTDAGAGACAALVLEVLAVAAVVVVAVALGEGNGNRCGARE